MKDIRFCFGALTVLALLPAKILCQSSALSNSASAVDGDSATGTPIVSGVVRTALNVTVPGAMVRVVHLPSGRSWVTWTDDDGSTIVGEETITDGHWATPFYTTLQVPRGRG